jgi:hypothetical protein
VTFPDPIALDFDKVLMIAFFGALILVIYTAVLRPWLRPRISGPAIEVGIAVYFIAYMLLTISHLTASYAGLESAIETLARSPDALRADDAKVAKDALLDMRQDALNLVIGVILGLQVLAGRRRDRVLQQKEAAEAAVAVARGNA